MTMDPSRALLFVEAIIMCLLYSHLIGRLWRGPKEPIPRALLWAIRVTLVGIAGVALYVTAGQIKAAQLDTPFDAYAWLGLLSVTVVDVGLAWLIREQRRRERG